MSLHDLISRMPRSPSDNWPHYQDPPSGLISHAVADIIKLMELLELPVPHAAVLTTAIHTFVFFHFCVLGHFIWYTVRDAQLLSQRLSSGRPLASDPSRWWAPLLRLAQPRCYDTVIACTCWLTSFVASLFILMASISASEGCVGVIASLLVWGLWFYFGWRYSLPLKRQYTARDINRWVVNGMWLHTLLLLASLMMLPSLRRRIEYGIVVMHVRLTEWFYVCPSFLSEMAWDIVGGKASPNYKRIPAAEALESFVSWK